MGKAERRKSIEPNFGVNVTLDLVSDEFDEDEPRASLMGEPSDDELKDLEAADRKGERQIDGESSGRNGFMRYLASLAKETLLSHGDEVKLGKQMAFGRKAVRETVMESAVWIIPLHNAIDQLRNGEITTREIVDLDGFGCKDELVDRNLAILELLREFHIEATRYIRLLNTYLHTMCDEGLLEPIASLREVIAEFGKKIPLQDSFITQIADSVVSFCAAVDGDGSCEGPSMPPSTNFNDEPVFEADGEAFKAFGLGWCSLMPVAERIDDGLGTWREAQSQVIRSNLRLVICIAKSYMNSGVPFEDIVQEGNVGLMRATEKYEHQRGTRFSTYSAFWIRHAIIKAIERQARTIRLPGHIFEFSNRITTVSAAFQQNTGRAPTDSEIANILGVSERKVEQVSGYSRYRILPLLAERKDDCDLSLIDTVPDKTCLHPEHYIEECEIASGLDGALSVLTEKERLIVELRNGLKDGHPHSLREVGNILSLTRERIRQIEKAALAKMRTSGLADSLVAYI
ncbi:sigma-70 family RNA polymerase sigma factor [bacterium]|nr:sigma-70 family RNA polymerase sigma factor [bacterium]